jgi:transposase
MNSEERLTKLLTDLFTTMPQYLNEKQRRLLAACVARSYGYGGISRIHSVSGISRVTIGLGINELNNTDSASMPSETRQRKKGGGRISLLEKHPELRERVEKLISDNTFGDPEQVLFWTNLSLQKIADILQSQHGYKIGKDTVNAILEKLGYSKQVNRKMLQVGDPHPDRDAQFRFISHKATAFIAHGFPVISVDTKKKENIGNFKNDGKEYRAKKDARDVLEHDFPLKELGKVAPYGVYLVNDNTGFVNLGVSSDTAEFAVESIRRWWYGVGKNTFPATKNLYITCDSGGSNSSRSRLWKLQLACLAQETGLRIHVSHFPPGTSKWNKVEHRLFCYISKNWQGKPLVSVETVVNLIGSTTTTKGLKVICRIDENKYQCSIKVSDNEFERINISPIGDFGTWNYCIKGLK